MLSGNLGAMSERVWLTDDLMAMWYALVRVIVIDFDNVFFFFFFFLQSNTSVTCIDISNRFRSNNYCLLLSSI